MVPDCSIRVALVNLTALIECLTVLLEYIDLLMLYYITLMYARVRNNKMYDFLM